MRATSYLTLEIKCITGSNEINVYNNLNENKLEMKLTTKEKVTKLHKKRNCWLMRGPLRNQG